jgi:uncharacterized OB-fold protein
MSGSGPRFDQPLIEDEGEPFWEALKGDSLVIRKCNACGEFHYYPRPFCPKCWSEDVEWHEVSGKGTVYTYSTVYINDLPPFGGQVPYVAAIVELDEGPRMMTRLIDCTKDDITLGMAVEVDYQDLDGELKMAVFRPAV